MNKNEKQIERILNTLRRKVYDICSDYPYINKLNVKKWLNFQFKMLNNSLDKLDILYNNKDKKIRFIRKNTFSFEEELNYIDWEEEE